MSDQSFLGLPFTPLTIDHQDIIESVFQKFPQRLSRYVFFQLYGWRIPYKYMWVMLEDETLLIAGFIKQTQHYHLLQPVGNFNSAAQKQLLEALLKWDYPVQIHGVSKEFIDNFTEFCSYFDIQDQRARANYLYKASDLALLKGRNYEKKRNLISQINKMHQWTVRLLQSNCEECPKILVEIGNKENGGESLQNEISALKSILENFDRLHLKGYMIGINGKPVAFSMIGTLNPSTQVVLFEKADRSFKGLYQLINQETAKAISEEGFEWINREEDLDNEGLRKAKMSYHPAEIIPSYILTIKSTL